MHPILLGLNPIDLAVVGAVGVVAPVALRRRWAPWPVWALAAVAAGLSLRLERGSAPAVGLALPWLALALGTAVVAVPPALRRSWRAWTAEDVGTVVGAAWVVAAAASLVLSRAGVQPMGIYEPIVELSAVHFTYVGAGAVSLATGAAVRTRRRRSRPLGRAALALTVGAPPVVALGFLSDSISLPTQVGGAVLLTVGVWLTAGLELARAFGRDGDVRRAERVCLVVSGLAVWVPMVLAVAWAAGQHWSLPILSILDMARTHGAANAIGFIGAGLLAQRLARPTQEVTPWR